MNNSIELTQFDTSLVKVPPMAVFFEFRDQLDIDQLYVSILKTLKLFPTFSAKFLGDGEYSLCYILDYFGFHFSKSLDKKLSSSPHRNTDLKNLSVLGFPRTTEQPVLNIFVIHKANGTQLTINLSHGVADGASLKLFTFQLFSFLKNKGVQITPLSQKKIHLEESDKELNTQVSYKSHLVNLENCSFRSGYFNEFIIPFDKVKTLYQKMCSSKNAEDLKLHDVVSSLLLKRLAPHLSYNNEEINLIIPVDVRNLYSSLNSYYIGNGFVEAFYSWKLQDFLLIDTVDLAVQIHQVINKFSDVKFLNSKLEMGQNGLSFEKFNKREIHDFAYDEFVALTSLGRANSLLSISDSTRIGIIADNSYNIAVFRINCDYVINITSSQQLPNLALLD